LLPIVNDPKSEDASLEARWSFKEGNNYHAAFQQTLWFDLLSFIQCRTDPRRHHLLPDYLLFLFLLLLIQSVKENRYG
jgi:hypothetical protein